MEPKEIEITKKLIEFLEVVRKSDYITYNAMVDSENLKKILKSVKEITQWGEEDDKRIGELAEKFKTETKGKTLKEKSEKLKNLLKISGGIGLIGGIGFAAYKIFKKGAKK